MSELRRIGPKHKQGDAEIIRRVLPRLQRMRGMDKDLVQVILMLTNHAWLIDQAFEAKVEAKDVPAA